MSGLHTLSVGSSGPRVAFCHGLFGQGRNWMQVAKGVSGPGGADARCLLIDLPDHGRSRWSETFSYEAYAAAVAETLVAAGSDDTWTLVGHSLGGKVAMLTALAHAEMIDRLVVVDIAPKSYGSLERFQGYIDAMRALPLAELADRGDAERRFALLESDAGVRSFLLQNLRREHGWHWRANLDLIAADASAGAASAIADWPDVARSHPPFTRPVLWIGGESSAYIADDDEPAMRALFPIVRQLTVKNAGHWVHTDAPEVVIAALRRFVGAL